MANSRKNHLLKDYCFILILMVFAYSCVNKDDYDFNYDKVKQMYEETYPVKEFDENQDWKTTRVINLNVSINEDALEEYKIKVYDACPYGDSIDVHKLVEGNLSNGESIDLKFDCPKIIKRIWVTRVDSHKRRVSKPISIDDVISDYQISFGETVDNSRSVQSRDVSIESISCPYSESKVNDMLRNAKEVPSGSAIDTGYGTYSSNRYYKLPGDVSNYQFVYNGNDIYDGSNKRCFFIIDKEIKTNGTLRVGNGNMTLIVAKGGKIKDSDIFLTNASNIVVMPGGEIDAAWNQLKIDNAITQYLNYNAGTINIDNLSLNGIGTVFYNAVNLYAKNIYNRTSTSTFKNNGHIEVTSDILCDVSALENSCYIKCNGNCYFRSYILGESSYLECGNLNIDSNSNNYSYTMDMAKNSIAKCNGTASLYIKLTGPTSGYALFKSKSLIIPGFNWGRFYIKNHVYVEVENLSLWSFLISKFLYLQNGATFNYYGESPIYIPSGDCSGEGNTPTNQGGDSDDENTNVFTYCYEDYYPYPGDYDFNDIVMDMSYNLKYNDKNITEVNMDIDLAAVGASYQLGAALQLIGIDKGVIKSVTVSGNKMRNTGLFDTKDNESNKNNNYIIPLFDDAHYQLKGISASGLLNTMQGHEDYKDASKSRITVNIKFKDGVKSFGLDNLDLFVARNLLGGYYAGQKDKDRIEIHLYEFWKNKTNRAVDFDKNEEAAAKRTWAICVPNFKYPYEYVPIYNLQNGELNNKECAYPDFGTWAANRNDAQDWYKHPNSGTTYR